MIAKRRPLMPLFSIVFLDEISISMVFPMLTIVFFNPASELFDPGTAMATRKLLYGLCMSLSYVGNMLAAPIIGHLSDHVGRRRMILIASFGALLFSLSAAGGVLLSMVGLLLAGRLISGMCARLNPVALATVADMSTRQNKLVNMGPLQLIISVGAFFGPIIAGFLVKHWFTPALNFSGPLFFSAGMAVLAILVVVVTFRETAPLHMDKPELGWASIKALLKNKAVLTISLLLLLSQLSWSTYYHFMPPLLKQLQHYSPSKVSFFVGMVALWLALAASIGIRFLQKRFSVQGVLTLGAVLMLVGLVLNGVVILTPALASIDPLYWLLAIPIAAGDMFMYSAFTTLYSNAVHKTRQGQIMGASFIVISVTWASTSLLGGVMLVHSMVTPMIFAIGGVAVALVLLLLPRIRTKLNPS